MAAVAGFTPNPPAWRRQPLESAQALTRNQELQSVTINLHNCRILLALTPEQFESFIEASRDGRAIVTTAETVPPPSDPPPAASGGNVIRFPLPLARVGT